MGKYSKKILRTDWQEEKLQNAMRVLRASRLSTNTAPFHHKVSRKALRTYLVENKQSKSEWGRKPVLSLQQEKELSKRITRQSETGTT